MSAPTATTGRVMSWGIAGYGWLGRDFVAPAIARAGNGRLVGTAESLAAAEELLGEVDLLYVAAPNHAHRQLVEAAARAGRDVLCEKPLANSLADARAMVAACEGAGVRLGTAFNQRWHGAHRTLRALVAQGRLGTVTQVRIHYACTAPAWWGADDWHFDPQRAGGGALWDLAPHGLDLAAWLVGEPIAQVAAVRGTAVLHEHSVEDGAVIAGRFERGALLAQQVSYATPETLPRRTLELYGTRAMARALDTMGQERGGTLELLDAADGLPVSVAIPREWDRDPFEAQVEAFAAGEWPSRPDEDLRVMELLESCR